MFFFLAQGQVWFKIVHVFKKNQVLRNPNENNFSSQTEWVTAVITGELVSAFMSIYIFFILFQFL